MLNRAANVCACESYESHSPYLLPHGTMALTCCYMLFCSLYNLKYLFYYTNIELTEEIYQKLRCNKCGQWRKKSDLRMFDFTPHGKRYDICIEGC